MIRGLVLRPETRSITEEMIDASSLSALYKVIGCKLIEIAYLDNGHILVCDEMGLLRKNLISKIYGYDIAGTAIIFKDNDEEFGACELDIEEVENNVRLGYATV